MITRDSLGIFWKFQLEDEQYQDEVGGLIFYGFWKKNFPGDIQNSISDFQSIWLGSTVFFNPRVWESISNAQLSIEVRIDHWPSVGWLDYIEKSLKWFVDLGAQVSWCGTEFSSPSLAIFDVDESAGEIYAAYSNSLGLICKSDLFEEYKELGPDDLNAFKKIILEDQ